MPLFYVLNEDGEPVPENDLLLWGKCFESDRSRIASTKISEDVSVSTVFVGMDHRLGSDRGPPLLFETMIFGGPNDEYCRRYATRAQALKGHEEVVQLARGS